MRLPPQKKSRRSAQNSRQEIEFAEKKGKIWMIEVKEIEAKEILRLKI